MRIANTGRNGRRITFTKPNEGLLFIAGMNESHGSYESAAKLYRQAGDEESAKRCDEAHAQSAARSARRTPGEGKGE